LIEGSEPRSRIVITSQVKPEHRGDQERAEARIPPAIICAVAACESVLCSLRPVVLRVDPLHGRVVAELLQDGSAAVDQPVVCSASGWAIAVRSPRTAATGARDDQHRQRRRIPRVVSRSTKD